MKAKILFFVFGTLLGSNAWSQQDSYFHLRDITRNGGSGYFNCAYKGKKASKPCKVIVKQELVTHPDVVNFKGKAEREQVLIIKWPDGDTSKYSWSDSGEMWNLTEKQAGGYHLSGDEITQDWSRGFVIEKEGSEYVRIW
ncbi:hypothetical protein [Chromatium okenii]|jgi:hypothetical protein|uniref:Uncharacterized protein n=1 Tax=Chromatium okenii TaxID=61644 RepID=A0A2S7XPE5_9GAMM|nr:hypothetical protein [Chromatium okenii]MBV5309407.1 hypothetical protein [Chromatium okenii]PQJ95546.1 hypothetical protein CXB77_15550 [Chromatium okenii]